MQQKIILKAIEAKLNSHGIEWASVRTFHIDREAKRLTAELVLEGEPTAIIASALYLLDADTVHLQSIDADRPWIAGALQLALSRHGGRIPLPPGIQGSVLRMML